MPKIRLIFTGLLIAIQLNALALPRLTPSSDDEVVEVLSTITRSRPGGPSANRQAADPAAAGKQAREGIAMARQTGDTRYWGRAQAVLAPWWDRPDAPVELAILQATVQQGRHEFEASRKILTATVARSASSAQGWLTLASLERLSGDYPAAMVACKGVARAGQALYASACELETLSLQGQQQRAARGLQRLIAQVSEPSQRSWLLSLQAENEERAGHDQAAQTAYQQSLALDPDLYTSIAYSDLLLRTRRTTQALQVLEKLPETDAVLLRRATAWRQLGDTRWSALHAQLRERKAELVRRGDDPLLHGRELALVALWLDEDASAALQLARRNLQLQREPIDWWVALASARLAKDQAAITEIADAIRKSGLQDSRLGLGNVNGANGNGVKP